MDERTRLIAEIAGRILATQLTQIKLWRSDDVDVERLERLSVEIASGIVMSAERVSSRG